MQKKYSNLSQNNERGSAIFLILIGVMLFAALGFAVGDMMRGGNAEKISEQKAGLYADEIIDYGRQMKTAVQSMRISNGCDKDEISFTQEASDAYEHSPTLSNGCKVFQGDGGSVSYVSPSSEASDGTDWVFTGANIVDGVGTAAPDLVAILPGLKRVICSSINDKLGRADPAGDATISYTPFTGSYAGTQTLDDANDELSGCLIDNASGDSYLFYQTLIVR